jgi:dienelactone hydrolase
MDPAAHAREFMDLLAKKDYAAAHELLNDDLKMRLPAPALEQLWKQVQDPHQAGEFRQFRDSRTELSRKDDVVFLTCEFEKLKLDARIPVNKAGQVSSLVFLPHIDYNPPDYVKTAAFREQEVVVGKGEWELHGALTVPNGAGPFPAVVLVHGSGAADRDYTLGPNQVFRDLAWGLSSRGIVVLRYNKRGNEYPEQVSRLANLTAKEETIDDALAAVELLRGTKSVDSHKIFVLGHSLGGTLAPRIGQADPAVAGLIVLAGTTHEVLDLIIPQMKYNFSLHGPISEEHQYLIDQMAQAVARAKDPKLAADAPAIDMPLRIPASYWLDLRDYHPEKLARGLKQPMFILQAGRDYQVTADDFDAWKRGLDGRKDVQFQNYPKLNHLFLEGEGPSSDEEYRKPGHVAGPVIEDLAAWIKKH